MPGQPRGSVRWSCVMPRGRFSPTLFQDAAYQNLRYFEMTAAQARAFLDEE